MTKTGAAGHTRLLLGVGLGLLALAGGVSLARARLPEWEARLEAPRQHFEARFLEIAERAGFRAAAGRPRVYLCTQGAESTEPYRWLGEEGSEWLRSTKSAVRVQVIQEVDPGSPRAAILMADLSLDGTVQTLAWVPARLVSFWQFGAPGTRRLGARLAAASLAHGEALGSTPLSSPSGPVERLAYPIVGAARPQHLLAISPGSVIVQRRPGPATRGAMHTLDRQANQQILGGLREVLVFLAVAGLFGALLIRRRLGATNAAVLAGLTLLSLNPLVGTMGFTRLAMAVAATAITLWTFVVWACGESLLRTSGKDATTSLDALRRGCLGPRGGRALLVGFAWGAGLAGVRLAALSALDALPGVWLPETSQRLPLFSGHWSPVAEGVGLAGMTALGMGLAVRIVPVRWAGLAAAAGVALLASPLAVSPWPAGAVASLAFAGVLVWICQRYGLTALLVSAIGLFLLPSVAMAALHLTWTTPSLAVAATITAALPLAGLVGLSRPAAAERARMEPPAFVRRQEETKRLQHEMGLLARMQKGLLPPRLPQLPGWEIAARSLIANEAGGDLYDFITDDEGFVWVAAGDVAGHGYSCAIAQAMTKAALVGLIGRRLSVGEVLTRADRVLRTAGPNRHFTTLALLRLDPETGAATFANAGHPPAYLVAEDGVRELAMPGLPLGMGPSRRYDEAALTLAPGATLIFGSDGLFEALDADGRVYGFGRLPALLSGVSWRTADRILDAVVDDWRSHLRTLLPRDDTTVVVLKRKAGIG